MTTGNPRTKKRDKRLNGPITSSRNGSPAHGDTMENAIARVALERSRAGKALQVLTGKLMAAQEEERRRIGRELHDGLNQQLAMFAVELGMLARQAPAEATMLIASILSLRQRAESLSDDLRQISHQLHPAVLEHLGLRTALRSLCADFTRSSGIRAWFSADGETDGVPRDIAICLYRVTQEALRNVVKHSCATEAWVRINRNRVGVQLSVIDKGVGFNINSSPRSSLGLVSMRERIQIVEGHFQIESVPTQGTAIRITVPVT
jgi:signal transduction histidine kinase